MKSRPKFIVSALFLTMLFSIQGFAQEGTIDRYKSASLDGTTGLFKTWDADALRQKEFNLSFGGDVFHRDPGKITVGRAVIGSAFGITDRFEVFGAFDVYKKLSADNIEPNRPMLKPYPSTIAGGDGLPYFSQTVPFIDETDPSGRGDFMLGLKFNLASENRGAPLSTGFAGFAVFPSGDKENRMNEGLTTGAYKIGIDWLLSKTIARTLRLHLNLGANMYTDPDIDGRTPAKFQNEFEYRAGIELPAFQAYRFIVEYTGVKYFGGGSPDVINPSVPMELIAGIRAYPARWMSFGFGYQGSLNHINDGDVPGAESARTHGFVVQAALGVRRNDPPTLACAVAKTEILQESSTTVRANAVDPEGDPLTFDWSVNGGKITGNGDTVTYETADAAPGVYNIGVTVSDGKHDVSCSTQITVLKKNYPPTVSVEPASISMIQGESKTLNANASDPNNDALTYEWTVDGEKLAASGPQVTFGSEGRMPGNYDVKVTVSDGEASAESIAKVTVKEKPNKLPTIDCVTAAVEVTSGDTVTLNAQAQDPEGGSLVFTWSSPVGRIAGSGSTVSFDATGVKAGSYTVTVTVEDPRAGKATCTMMVNVSERLSITKDKCGYFAYRGTRVDNCAKAILDDLSVRMKNEPQLRANIIGYVDGKYEVNNKSLGEQRAKAVAAYLEKKGVESSRLTVTNGGAGDPVGDNSTSAGRRLNRRAVIELSVK